MVVIAGERAKKYKNWWSRKMLKILQRKMQFEKCFLKKNF
jgi:hypothetical protein